MRWLIKRWQEFMRQRTCRICGKWSIHETCSDCSEWAYTIIDSFNKRVVLHTVLRALDGDNIQFPWTEHDVKTYPRGNYEEHVRLKNRAGW